jgi:hypothetical protein
MRGKETRYKLSNGLNQRERERESERKTCGREGEREREEKGAY